MINILSSKLDKNILTSCGAGRNMLLVIPPEMDMLATQLIGDLLAIFSKEYKDKFGDQFTDVDLVQIFNGKIVVSHNLKENEWILSTPKNQFYSIFYD